MVPQKDPCLQKQLEAWKVYFFYILTYVPTHFNTDQNIAIGCIQKELPIQTAPILWSKKGLASVLYKIPPHSVLPMALCCVYSKAGFSLDLTWVFKLIQS